MTYEPWFEDGRTGALAAVELQRAASSMLRARRSMRGVMPEPLMSDLPLELMLALFIAHPAACAIDELALEVEAPDPMVLRWIGVLEAERLAARDDGVLMLTRHGAAEMTELMTRVVRSQREFYGWQQ